METFDDGSQTIKSFEVFFSVGGWCLGLVVCLMVVGWLNSSYATQKSHSQTRMCDSASDIHPNVFSVFFSTQKMQKSCLRNVSFMMTFFQLQLQSKLKNEKLVTVV